MLFFNSHILLNHINDQHMFSSSKITVKSGSYIRNFLLNQRVGYESISANDGNLEARLGIYLPLMKPDGRVTSKVVVGNRMLLQYTKSGVTKEVYAITPPRIFEDTCNTGVVTLLCPKGKEARLGTCTLDCYFESVLV